MCGGGICRWSVVVSVGVVCGGGVCRWSVVVECGGGVCVGDINGSQK